MDPTWQYRFHSLKAIIPYVEHSVDISTPWPAIMGFGSSVVYLFFLLVGFKLMKPSDATVKKFGKIHHALLFVFSAFVSGATLYHMYESGTMWDFQRYICEPLPSWLRMISILFTISKIWEWGDTAILIWKGKTLEQIGFLHAYHHMTTFCLFLNVMNFPSTERGGMLLNGFVHTLMYYHFAFRLPRFMRPWITGAQIIQLAVVTYHWSITPGMCPGFGHYPTEHFWEFLVPYLMVPVYLMFFIKFFVQQYLLGAAKSAKKTQ